MLFTSEEGTHQVEVVTLSKQNGAAASVGVTPLPKAEVLAQAAAPHDLAKLCSSKAWPEHSPQPKQQIDIGAALGMRIEGHDTQVVEELEVKANACDIYQPVE